MLVLLLLGSIASFLKVGVDGETGVIGEVGDGNVKFVNPASLGEDGKTSLGDAFLVVGERLSGGRSKCEMSRGDVEVFIEKSRVDVFEDAVVEVSDCVEEDVRARRRRASGIVIWLAFLEDDYISWGVDGVFARIVLVTLVANDTRRIALTSGSEVWFGDLTDFW